MEGSQSRTNLIFDIGAHNGDDTAVYLQLGYNVISIEANPALVEVLKKRFADEIKAGRLHVVHAAITDRNMGDVVLYLQHDTSKSSLFSGETHQKINVPGRTLAQMIHQFGKPFYCKIDIEGGDLSALQSLSENECPNYISVELTYRKLGELRPDSEDLYATLKQLTLLGYTRFKLVDQERLQTLNNQSFYKRNLILSQRIKQKLLTLFRMDDRSQLLKRFGLNSDAELSGFPTFLLKDRWYTSTEMQELIRFHFTEYRSITDNPTFTLWVDLNASFAH
jgi:FkbM family methyltransferase